MSTKNLWQRTIALSCCTLFTLLLLAAGFTLLVRSSVEQEQRQRLITDGQPITGTVTAIEQGVGRGVTFDAIIEYVVDDVHYTHRERMKINEYVAGQSVDLLYNPADPKNADIPEDVTEKRNKELTAIGYTLAIFLLANGILFATFTIVGAKRISRR